MTDATPAPPWIGTLKRAAIAVLWALFIAIGVLQMDHVRGPVTANGADIVCPAVLYVTARQGKSFLRIIGLDGSRKVAIALGVFALSVGWEICQRLHWIPGVFDPLDIVAHAIGVAAPYAVDSWLQHNATTQEQ